MQILLLIVVGIVVLEDRAAREPLTGAAVAVLLVPIAVALVLQAAAIRRTLQALDDPRGSPVRALQRADRSLRLTQWTTVAAMAAATFGFGWVAGVRSLVGDLPAVDELVALSPALVAFLAGWWIQYPLERRIREASLVRRLDGGLPVAAVPGRTEYVIGQARAHLLLLLVPLLCIMTLSDLSLRAVDRFFPAAPPIARDVATIGSAVLVLLASPFIARVVLDLRPLPEGELRRELSLLAERCGVRVNRLYLWKTGHTTANAAVIGLAGPLRCVLLTDALLESLPRDELLAVMAHEIGHVRLRHLPWTLAMLAALLGAGGLAVTIPFGWAESALGVVASDPEGGAALAWLDRGAACAVGLAALVAFGWISRRLERQADTFSVRCLSRDQGAAAIAPNAVRAMCGALGSVAAFSGIDPERPSWRHGSIRWRQRYLVGLLGSPLSGLRIDRIVRGLKIGTVVVLIGMTTLFL